MIGHAPEALLKDVLREILSATSKEEETNNHRKIAVLWFNRLYYDVRRWNENFIKFMKGEDQTEEGVEEYRRSLEHPHGEVKSKLCRNLEILTGRFQKDFQWLKDEDEKTYRHLKQLLHGSYASEYKIIHCAHEVVTRQISLESYEQFSSGAIYELDSFAREAGIALLTVSEYDEILKTEEPSKSKVIVIEEVNVGPTYKNVQNSTIVNDSFVENSFNKIKSDFDEQTANAFKKIAKEIITSKNQEAEDNFKAFSKELEESEPKKFVLKSLWKDVADALPSILQMTDVVSKITKLFGA